MTARRPLVTEMHYLNIIDFVFSITGLEDGFKWLIETVGKKN
jgi:hypothetical protein